MRGGALDALRFFAAFFVVVYHYGDEAPVVLDTLHPIFFRGYLATDFFLMLSGYVLGLAYGASVEQGRIRAPEFLARRLTRIWPSHLIVLAVMSALVILAHLVGFDPHHAGRFNWRDLPPQALLIQAWADVGGGGWNLPSWSLSALIFGYAVFPMLWRALQRVNPWVGVGLAAVVVALLNHACWTTMGRGLFDLPFHLGVLRALPLFALGVSLACLTRSKILARGASRWIASTATVTLIALQLFTQTPSDVLSIALIAAIIVTAGSFDTGAGSRVIEEGGRLSFSLFITHVLAAIIWFGIIHAIGDISTIVRWIAWTLSLPFALGVASLFDRAIDQPIQAWLKPWLLGLFAQRRAAIRQTAA